MDFADTAVVFPVFVLLFIYSLSFVLLKFVSVIIGPWADDVVRMRRKGCYKATSLS